MEFRSNFDRTMIPGFELIELPTTFPTDLWRDCLENYQDWALLTIRRVIIAGGAGWVDPQFGKRKAHYNWDCASNKDLSRMRFEAHRHSHMVAKATLEDCIPKEVFDYMRSHGHNFMECPTDHRDLCSLIMNIHDFMLAGVRSRQD